MTNTTDQHSVRSVLKLCTLPLAIMWGLIIGGFVGAFFGAMGVGAAIGVGIGVAIGVGLTALYAVTFFESEG
ncbi:MAG: hypothetical protein OEQ25_14610 [Gammaproteobacteria bacterium]|nr:hypothetical protein [Gammaproteobacteria bacterium]MDH3508364.1 hypothetical protein [Gammaproteobacteria bacterium]